MSKTWGIATHHDSHLNVSSIQPYMAKTMSWRDFFSGRTVALTGRQSNLLSRMPSPVALLMVQPPSVLAEGEFDGLIPAGSYLGAVPAAGLAGVLVAEHPRP
jgi:hypothetical protein